MTDGAPCELHGDLRKVNWLAYHNSQQYGQPLEACELTAVWWVQASDSPKAIPIDMLRTENPSQILAASDRPDEAWE